VSTTIRIRCDLDDLSEREVSLEEATTLVAQALARGLIVIDRKSGKVVRELGPGVDDIFIVELLDGG
jgi:hypothetical protein